MTFNLPVVLGHRGARAVKTENTIEAFRYACQSGIKWVELDAMLSAGSADSEIGRLNADGSGTLSEETAGLVKRGLESVTIVSNDGTLADALSTSLFIMGKEQAIQYWRAHSDEFGCILLDEDDELFVSENIVDSFHSDNYPVTVFE